MSIGKKKTHEEFCEQFYELVGNEYSLLSKYIKYHEHVNVRHNVCGYKYFVTPANFIRGYRCPNCNGGIKSNTEKFKEKIFLKYGDEYTVLVEYVRSYIKILMRHNVCGTEYMVIPNDILSGNKCFICSGLQRKNIDIIKQQVFDKYENEYSVNGEYKNNKTKLLFTHHVCGNSFLMNSNNFFNGEQCPFCMKSKGEQLIKLYLDTRMIDYIPQKEFKGLIGINKGNLSYDFYLSQYNLLIEYQGKQHEKYIKGFHKSKKDFEKQLEHDRRKREYAINNNIKLLEIWYKDFDNIEIILNNYLKDLQSQSA